MSDQRCPVCEEWLELNEDNFQHDKSSPTGFDKCCKTCKNAHNPDYHHGFVDRPERRIITTEFDEACERDRLRRRKTDNISIYQEAF